jgi:hypothetical protein
MAAIDALFDREPIIDNNGNVIDLKKLCAGKIVGIYFSSNWNEKSIRTNLIIKSFYKRHNKNNQFEIIFINVDRNNITKDIPSFALKLKNHERKV